MTKRDKRLPALGLLLVTVILVVLFLVVIGSSAVKGTADQVNDSMENLKNILKGDVFPKESKARRILYFYRPQPEIVIDGNAEDWEKAHGVAVEEKEGLQKAVLYRTDPPHSWLNSYFFKTELEHFATSHTPYTANAIQVLQAPQSSMSIQNAPALRIWFARDDDGKRFYMLGRMVNVGSGRSVRLRLTMYYNNLEKRVFVVYPERGGDLKIYEITSPSSRDSDYNHHELPPEEVAGKWWESGQDEYFELALRNLREVDAIRPIAYAHKGSDSLFGFEPGDKGTNRGPDNFAQFLVSSPSRLPIGSPKRLPISGGSKEIREISTYAIADSLRHVRYEVWREGQVLLFSPETDNKNYGTRLLSRLRNPIYRLSLWFNRISACSNEDRKEGLCFAHTPRGYWLRSVENLEQGKQGRNVSATLVSDNSGQQEKDAVITVMTEKPLVIHFSGTGLVILVVVLLPNVIHYFADRKSRRDNSELEQANERLDQTHKALESYDQTFIHQANNDLFEVRQEASDLAASVDAGDRKKHLLAINKAINSMFKCIADSREILRYEERVRKLLAEYENHGGFDLYHSIASCVKRIDHVDLHPAEWTGSRPILGATGPGGENKDGPLRSQDEYFLELLKPIINNAIQRRSENSRVTVSLHVEQNCAVVRVSNHGSTVSEDKLEEVFGLGLRYETVELQDGKKHLGLGLFVVSQITRAHRGSCRLDNLPDGSGVVVTVRLPVTFRPVAPRHR